MEEPIGIFDSGVGGLTVLKEVINHIPSENILYFGDTARVPYGTRSSEKVIDYSIQSTDFLLSKGIKLLIVACNTSSAVSIQSLENRFSIPVIGVIKPGAKKAVEITRNKKVGVIGTERTIASEAYVKYIREFSEDIEIISKACPLFVPLVEEGWTDNDVAYRVADTYLREFKNNGVDVLVLGCTHYPLLKIVIGKVVGRGIHLVDSARETASVVRDLLTEGGIANKSLSPGYWKFFTTDNPEKFIKVGEHFLGKKLNTVLQVEVF
ncbi:MAG: glutamate racemase [Thermodesulfobacteriota bacterium]|nr:glutamate racemase [Thermodesulfobacteriota bacterium]